MQPSAIQRSVLKLIAANRSPDSYVAGATVLHRDDGTPRFSLDLDLSHDAEDNVAQSADAATLQAADYDFSWLLRTPSFHRALVTADEQQLKIEWGQDSACRFYPVQQDDRFGFRLYDADTAVNKVPALAGRSEIRDFVDVIHLDQTYLSLGAMAWAAYGKDPGFTLEFLLDHIGRHSAYSQSDIDRLSLREPLDATVLKKQWFAALEKAQKLAAELPPDEVGCLYLNPDQNLMTPVPEADEFATMTRHRGSVRGTWPTVSGYRKS